MDPDTTTDGLVISEIDFSRVIEERQNFDVVGHYSRPDVTKLMINRDRQSILDISDKAM